MPCFPNTTNGSTGKKTHSHKKHIEKYDKIIVLLREIKRKLVKMITIEILVHANFIP